MTALAKLRVWLPTVLSVVALSISLYGLHRPSVSGHTYGAVYTPNQLIGSQTWPATATTPTLTQAAQTSDVATNDIVIQPQSPFASAVTNVVGGNMSVNLAVPSTGSVMPAFRVKFGSNIAAAIQSQGGSALTGLYFGNITIPSATNFALLGDGTSATYLNAVSGGTDHVAIAGVDILTGTATGISAIQPITLNRASLLASPQTIACGTGGTQTVAASTTAGLVVTSGTLGSNCVIDFSTNATSGDFTLDTSGVTLGATFGVQFKNGTASSTVITSGNVLAGATYAHVWTHGTNTLSVAY